MKFTRVAGPVEAFHRFARSTGSASKEQRYSPDGLRPSNGAAKRRSAPRKKSRRDHRHGIAVLLLPGQDLLAHAADSVGVLSFASKVAQFSRVGV